MLNTRNKLFRYLNKSQLGRINVAKELQGWQDYETGIYDTKPVTITYEYKESKNKFVLCKEGMYMSLTRDQVHELKDLCHTILMENR